ncbi:membrane protein [Escherichia phage Phagiculus]
MVRFDGVTIPNHGGFVFSKKCYSLDLWIVAVIAMIHITIANTAIFHRLQQVC